MNEKLPGVQWIAWRREFNMRQNRFAALLEISTPYLSLMENGLREATVENTRKARSVIAGLRRIQKKYGKVKLNMNDLPFIRRELRKLGTSDVKLIPQEWGAEFIAEWCARVSLTPRELGAMEQLRSVVAEAEVISAPCQRWIRAFIAAVDQILDGKNFDAYAKKFKSRAEAITKLANDAFAGLIHEVGREKMLEYLHALLLTGELKQAPRDVDEN